MLSPSEPKLGVTLLLRTWGVGYVTPTPPRDRTEEVEWGVGWAERVMSWVPVTSGTLESLVFSLLSISTVSTSMGSGKSSCATGGAAPGS